MNYPNGIKKANSNIIITYNNRGMTLENEINLSNEYYREIDKAHIYKKPTPIKITKVDYPSRDKAVIKEAYFTTPSTTDYNGIYKGKYIDFEAKETKSNTSFTLSNIHPHQIQHLTCIDKHKGIAFLIIRFNYHNKTYILPGNTLINFLKQNKRKSIPYDFFTKNCKLVELKYIPRLDYLKTIEIL